MSLAMDTHIVKLAITFGVAKGVIISTAVVGLDIQFWKALIIAVVAALIGFAGSMLAAYYAVREARKNREIVTDVSRKISADRRQSDAGVPGDRDGC